MFLRRLLRFQLSDGFSFTFLIASVISVFCFELLVVLPGTDEGLIPMYVHVTLGTYVFVNILWNFYLTMRVDSSTRKIILPAILKPGWHFCAACEANAPSRAFHCSKCNVCVLRRDHHCAFGLCCIGLNNYRYFIHFLLFLSVGAAYASFFNLYFIWDVLGGFSLFSLIAHIVPFVFWIFGYLSLWAFTCTFISILSISGVLFVTNLLIFHVRQLVHNQTTFEKNHGILMYDLGLRKNLVETLGNNWHICWIIPIIPSQLPSDGLSYRSNENSSGLDRNNFLHENLRQRVFIDH